MGGGEPSSLFATLLFMNLTTGIASYTTSRELQRPLPISGFVRFRCEELVQAYLQDLSPESKLVVGGDMRKINHCFALLKVRTNTVAKSAYKQSHKLLFFQVASDYVLLIFLKSEVLERSKAPPQQDSKPPLPDPENTSGNDPTTSEAPPPPRDDDKEAPSSLALKLELEMLQERLRQRDSEIRILLRMMKQERKRADRAEASLGAAGGRVQPVSPVSPDRVSPLRLARSVEGSIAPTPTPVSATNTSALGNQEGDDDRTPGGGDEGKSLRGAEVAGGGGVGSGGGGHGSQVGGAGVSASVSTSSGDGEWKAALKAGMCHVMKPFPLGGGGGGVPCGYMDRLHVNSLLHGT